MTVHSYCLISNPALPHFMETAKVPKFKWSEISELNSGHTSNEWGMAKAKPKQNIIIAYDISWNRQ